MFKFVETKEQAQATELKALAKEAASCAKYFLADNVILRNANAKLRADLIESTSTIRCTKASLRKASQSISNLLRSQPDTASSHTAMHHISRNAKFPIQDTGATDTFYRESDAKFIHDVKRGGGLVVGLPNGAAIRSIATGTLHTHPISIPVHIFPDDQLERSLNSTADFCNKGCTATFTATSMHIDHDSSGIIVASSTKLPTDKLWPSFDLSSTPTPISPTANIMVRHEINADFIEYTHACLGSPPDSSMLQRSETIYCIVQ